MFKFLIRLRKKTWLPTKWKWNYWKETKDLEVRTKEEILESIKKIKEEVIVFDRLGKEKDKAYGMGKISALNWVLYGKSKVKSS